MKSNVLKTVLPIAVIAFGLASAASTSSLGKSSKSVTQMGYKRINNPFQCIAVQNCNELQGYDCKAPDGVTQLYSDGASCNVPLKRNTPN
ncbi:DUF6520 family protein [Flavobacterium sp. SORGH_AS_0622]|uniref:DUF6520 family protein n=1 Tax=Flavobacterium sp. SORGH_AS_0622 TaxID=3041772 RepID=UPI002789DE7F|nr:DUF6520 family protein [Flavobacterium sp. SORGH_AS_0622]MDQ1164655.1 hypothetical protein [Flavobacterium sp. SORGH_AS_0622]